MAIARTAQGTKLNGSGNNPVNISIPGGTDFFICCYSDDGTPTETASLNGTPCTSRTDVLWYYSNTASTRVMYMLAPPTGTVSLATSVDGTVLAWAAYSGVHQSTPFNGSNETISLTESTPLNSDDTIAAATGELVLQLLGGLNGNGTPTGLQATQGATLVSQLFSDGLYAGIVEEAGAASVTVGMEPTGTPGTYWSIGSCLLRLNAASGVTTGLFGSRQAGQIAQQNTVNRASRW